MITPKTVYSMVDDFLNNENEADRKRFYKYVVDEAIGEYGGEDYVMNIMSIQSEDDFKNLDLEEKKIFINAFIKASIVAEVMVAYGIGDMLIINEEYDVNLVLEGCDY